MTLQTSGAISLLDIANEFGGSTPHAINEYYGAAAGIPSSGTISFDQFYGKSNVVADYYPSISYSGGTANYSVGAFGNILDGNLSTYATRSTLQPSGSTHNQHPGAIVLHWNNGAISAGSSLRFAAVWPSSFNQTVPIHITDGSGNVHQSSVTSQFAGVSGNAPLASLASSYPYSSISKIEAFNGYNPVFFYGIERSGSMLILP